MIVVSVSLTYRNTFFTMFAGSDIIYLVSGRKIGDQFSEGDYHEASSVTEKNLVYGMYSRPVLYCVSFLCRCI